MQLKKNAENHQEKVRPESKSSTMDMTYKSKNVGQGLGNDKNSFKVN